MESAFPYEETPDQLTAIVDVKDDMQQDRPMDRLVFGDVGYGKTEVAIRAAFKAVLDGRQVAVLVPTTLLAQQHHQTFSERFAPYPMRVEVLSRFLTQRQQKTVVEAMRRGDVDVVIGTHRLLSDDIHWKDLGLLVVDEEQRFGVNAKDAIKQLPGRGGCPHPHRHADPADARDGAHRHTGREPHPYTPRGQAPHPHLRRSIRPTGGSRGDPS